MSIESSNCEASIASLLSPVYIKNDISRYRVYI